MGEPLRLTLPRRYVGDAGRYFGNRVVVVFVFAVVVVRNPEEGSRVTAWARFQKHPNNSEIDFETYKTYRWANRSKVGTTSGIPTTRGLSSYHEQIVRVGDHFRSSRSYSDRVEAMVSASTIFSVDLFRFFSIPFTWKSLKSFIRLRS